MTIETPETRIENYTGNDVTTSFAVNFTFHELEVYADGVLQTEGSGDDYTITGGAGSTGSVEFNTAPATDVEIAIVGETVPSQSVDIENDGGFFPTVIEAQLDRAMMRIQELEDRINTAVRAPAWATALSAFDFSASPESFLATDENGDLKLRSTVAVGITQTVIDSLLALAYKATVGTNDIDNRAVTFAKIEEIDNERFLGRISGGSGSVEELTAANLMTYLRDVETNYTAQQYFGAATLTDAANVDWNLSTQQVGILTLGGNRVMNAPTNLKAGATYILIVKQDGAGGRTLDFSNATYKFPGGTEPVLSGGSSAVDVISFVSDGASLFGTSQYNFS